MSMARGAVMLGQKPQFRRFLSQLLDVQVTDETEAANAVRAFCRIESRRQLNTNAEAADRYRQLICFFNDWMNNKPLQQENSR
ncbi:hypothetical protein ACXIVA_22705 [Vibrio parahaemolyticus]